MDEYIRREDAVNALAKTMPTPATPDGAGEFDHEIHIADEAFADAIRIIESLEPADVVPTESQEIGYGQCANAMLKMWMDNVVTDGEYNRIMDRLNKLYFSGGEREE